MTLRRLGRLLGFSRLSEREYRANLDGLNIFFGAVLGFVMAGTESYAPRDFAMALFFTATMVITILYVSSGRQRLTYAALGGALIYAAPRLFEEFVGGGAKLPTNLQPALAVWLAMVVFVEFLPRERAPSRFDTEADGADGSRG